MKETWKDIVGFEGHYYISSLGKVKKNNGKIIKGSPNKNRRGYIYANLETKTKRKNTLVHRLVALHFIANPANKRCVNHIDFDVANNRVENLEWTTHAENIAHSVKNGRMAHNRGEKCGRGVLTEKVVISIIKQRNKTGMKYIDLAKKYKTNYSNIAHIMRGSRWGHIQAKNNQSP